MNVHGLLQVLGENSLVLMCAALILRATEGLLEDPARTGAPDRAGLFPKDVSWWL